MLKRVLFLLLGTIIGVLIVTFKTNEFPLEVFLGALTGCVLILVFSFIAKERKKDETPEVDERIISNMKVFLTYCLYGFVFVLGCAVVIFDLLDFEAIPIMYLYIFLGTMVLIIGIGGQIVKRS